METPLGSEEIIFGLNGPQLAVLGVLGVATYYIAKRIGRTLNGTSN